MAAFEDHVVLSVAVKKSEIKISAVQRGPEGKIIITEGLNLVSLFKVNSNRVQKSWSFKQTNSLTCPVVFDFANKTFVAIQKSLFLRHWKEADDSTEVEKKKRLPSKALCLASIANAEPVVVYTSGNAQLVSSALAGNECKTAFSLGERERIVWIDGGSFQNKAHVVLVVEEEWRKSYRICRHILTVDEEDGTAETIVTKLERNSETILAWCLNNKDLRFYTLWSDKQLFATDKNSSEIRLACSLNWTADRPPSSIAALDETHFVTAWLPVSASDLDSRLEIWDTKFAIRKALTYLPSTYYTGNSQLVVLDNVVYVGFERGIVSIPARVEPSSLASVLGKAAPSPEWTKQPWQKMKLEWKMRGLVSRSSRAKKSNLGIPEIFLNSDESLPKMYQDNITWLIDKGDVNAICKLLDSFSNVPESVLVDILEFFLRTREAESHVVNLADDSGDIYLLSEDIASLINRMLSLSYSDVFLLDHLRKLPFDSVMVLLNHLNQLMRTYPLSYNEPQNPSLDQIVEWITLLLDAHFSELIVSTSGATRKILVQTNETVSSLCKSFKDIQDISNLLTRIELGHPPETEVAGIYCIEFVQF